MKNLIFILLISALFSCSGGDDDVEYGMMIGPMEYKSFSPDSTNYFLLSETGKGTRTEYYIRKYKITSTNPIEREVVKERPYYIHSETINSGYGESKINPFSILHVSVLKNTVVVIAEAEAEVDNYKMLITFYDYNLDSITSIFSKNTNYQSYQQWGWNDFFIFSETKCDCYKSDRYSERGEFIKTINSSSLYFPANSDIILDDYTFVQLNDFGVNRLSEYSLTNGCLWGINLNDEIGNKPSTETNLPKIKIGSYSISGTILTINLNVTYYSGEKEIRTIKINSETGKVI